MEGEKKIYESRHVERFSSAYQRALDALRDEDYEKVLASCEEALAASGEEKESLSPEQTAEMRLLRGTFYILSKQQVISLILTRLFSLLLT